MKKISVQKKFLSFQRYIALIEADQKSLYQILLERIPAITYIAACDNYSTLLYISPQIEKLLGFSQAEFLSDQDFWKNRIHPEDLNRVLEELDQKLKDKGYLDLEYRMITRKGQTRWVRDECELVLSERGIPLFLEGVLIDITSRKNAEKDLKEKEAILYQLTENIRDIFWLSSSDKKQFFFVNSMYEKIWGRTTESLFRRPTSYLDAVHPQDRKRASAMANKQLHRMDEMKFRIIQPNGSIRWIRDRYFPILNEKGEPYRIAGFAEDITDLVKKEETILAYQEQLQALASQLSLAEERERRNIAQGLHDIVGQTLAVAQIKLGTFKKSLSSSELSKDVEEVSLLIENVIESLRTLIFEVSPPVLYELGLEAALEWLTEKFQNDYNIKIRFVNDGSSELISDDVRIILFQSIRELLFNVVKHSQGSKAKVSLKLTDKNIQCTIADNGIGFDVLQVNPRRGKLKGFGLFSIQERLLPFGGNLVIKSRPSKGSKMTITVPIKGKGRKR